MISATGAQSHISLGEDWSFLPLLEKETSMRLGGHQSLLIHSNNLSLLRAPQLRKTQSDFSSIFEGGVPFFLVLFYL